MEIESFQKQALAVEMPDENFDPTVEPTSGEEYLQKVIHERNQCPAVVVRPLTAKRTLVPASDLQALLADQIVDCASDALRPTPEWRDHQLENFIALRQKIIEYRRNLAENGFTSQDMTPLTDDEDAWKNFCQGNHPLLSTVLRIDQRSLECLLEFESNWLRERRDDEVQADLMEKDKWLGTWIYSTLACLHLPLEPSVFSMLRDIAKSCVLLRNKLRKEQEVEASPLNLFITLISKYFNQLDLAEFA